jgi:hypothetical protein
MKEIAYTMALGSIGIVGVQNQDQIKNVLLQKDCCLELAI